MYSAGKLNGGSACCNPGKGTLSLLFSDTLLNLLVNSILDSVQLGSERLFFLVKALFEVALLGQVPLLLLQKSQLFI